MIGFTCVYYMGGGSKRPKVVNLKFGAGIKTLISIQIVFFARVPFFSIFVLLFQQ
jgi:hypothetical protein